MTHASNEATLSSKPNAASMVATILSCSPTGGIGKIAFLPSAVPKRGIFIPYEHLLAYLRNVGDIR